MGKQAVPIWGELLDAFPTVTKKSMTYGTVHDEDLVLFPGAYPNNKFPSWGSKLNLEIAYGVEKDYYPLTSSCKTAFMIVERIFDKFLEDSGINADFSALEKRLHNMEEEICTLTAKDFNEENGLSQTDAKTKASYEKQVKKDKETLAETEAKVYTFYEQFIGATRFQGFSRVLQKVLDTEATFDRRKCEVVAEAYEKDSNGVSTGVRRPELDHTKDDAPGATHVLVWKVESTSYEEQAKYVKDKTAFEVARRLHRVQIMGNKYHVAESQKAYLQNNLRLPNMSSGVSARVLLGVIQNISEHMYLLPTSKDHPQLANVPEVVAANLPFTEMELCAMLKRAMPKRAISVYEAKRNSDCPAELTLTQWPQNLIRSWISCPLRINSLRRTMVGEKTSLTPTPIPPRRREMGVDMGVGTPTDSPLARCASIARQSTRTE